MTYYFAAYLVFWVALFAYLAGLTRRQVRLNRRAARIVDALAKRSEP